ncbi:ATP-binding cassette domain-containing protein, partial [Streptomyces sp. MCAF7]
MLRAIDEGRVYETGLGDSLSRRNLWARSQQIEAQLAEELDADKLDRFTDWLLDRVVLVGIRAANQDHGYRMFETMNDRGARLTAVDLLKSHLLANVGTGEDQLNTRWQEMLRELATDREDPGAASRFIKAMLLARYARPDHAEDRRQIDANLNVWVRQNAKYLGLVPDRPENFLDFVQSLLETARLFRPLLAASPPDVAELVHGTLVPTLRECRTTADVAAALGQLAVRDGNQVFPLEGVPLPAPRSRRGWPPAPAGPQHTGPVLVRRRVRRRCGTTRRATVSLGLGRRLQHSNRLRAMTSVRQDGTVVPERGSAPSSSPSASSLAALVVVGPAVNGAAALSSVVLVISLLALVKHSGQQRGQLRFLPPAGHQDRSAPGLAHRLRRRSRPEARPQPTRYPSRTASSSTNCCFTCPGIEHSVLNGATARLPAGSVVALVGENGAGKTTLAKLLGWFYDPDSGAIRVDGTGPDRFDIEDCRAHTIVGFHDFVHFQLTLGESVGIGDLSRLDDTAGID